MTPEQLAREIEDADSHDDHVTVILRVGMYRKLLATAEREAKLRKALESIMDMCLTALETKGEK